METNSQNSENLNRKTSFHLTNNKGNSPSHSTHDIFSTPSPSEIPEKIIINCDFDSDPYSFAQEIPAAIDEHLIFVVHGIGQDHKKLKNTLEKIKSTILRIYEKKSNLFDKQIHVRIIDWKTPLIAKEQQAFNNLVDYNNDTRYPKMFIQQVPLDVLHYLSLRNKYNILNDVVFQMNSYYDLVSKHRPLFKGNVSVVGHSLGSVILYEILTNMSNSKYSDKKSFNFGNIKSMTKSPQEDAFEVITQLDRSSRKDNLKEYLNKNVVDTKILDEIIIDQDTIDNNLPGIYSNSTPKEQSTIHSLDPNINPMKFPVDNLFTMGSPLSLFLSVEHGINYNLQEMETVKDFHNIIHPMDPVAYRIEPLIMDYTKFNSSFVLSHWENEGIHNFLFDHFMKFFFCDKGKVSNHRNKNLERKRYDFMVQEYPSERAVNVIGFLFSHMAYWNNPDVFYFVVKMIHGLGYQAPKTKN